MSVSIPGRRTIALPAPVVPVFITVRDLFDAPQRLAEQVAALQGGLPILCDNGSTYPPLVEWLLHCPWAVSRGPNSGNNVAWNRGLVRPVAEHVRRYGSAYFVVTDGDLDLTGVPPDALDRLAESLRHTGATKGALGLWIDDLPPPEINPDSPSIRAHESQFWREEIGGWTGLQPAPCPLYRAEADTHFCLYRAGADWTGYDAVRLGPPYVARHVPWYWDQHALPADAEWYVRHMDPAYSTWGNRIRHRCVLKDAPER